MEIKLIELPELRSLGEVFRNPSFQGNFERFQKQQEGNAAYIIAKQDGEIVGKMYLKYFGSHDIHIGNCPDMENLEVLESQRGKGIGTAIIAFAENLCQKKGYTQVGLGVALENEKARELYERLGYEKVKGPFKISFPWIREDGVVIKLTEEVIYLLKKLV